MKPQMILSLLIFITGFYPWMLPAKEPDNSSALFQIGRSRDANEIHYVASLDCEGNLVAENPVDIYWIRHTEGGRREPLTWVQNKYAYGIKYLEISSQKAVFQFVSYPSRTFSIQKSDQGRYNVYTSFENRKFALTRIFVQIENGSFWFPQITRVELSGIDEQTRQYIVESIEL
ncbi:MAG: DUF4833 domain-containing protein [Bacteroidales bacterium]|nr:DUF4833 domain-containing protein [Bacteroidales bacterium]